jgi:hypothetical protein
MTFVTIKGSFHFCGESTAGNPTRFQPDGDSMQFKPDRPSPLDRLERTADTYRLTSIGSTRLRLRPSMRSSFTSKATRRREQPHELPAMASADQTASARPLDRAASHCMPRRRAVRMPGTGSVRRIGGGGRHRRSRHARPRLRRCCARPVDVRMRLTPGSARAAGCVWKSRPGARSARS